MQTDFGQNCWHRYFGSKLYYKRSLKVNSQSGCIYFVTIINWSASRKKRIGEERRRFQVCKFVQSYHSLRSLVSQSLYGTNKGSDLCAVWYGPPQFADMLNNLFARRCLIGTEDWILSPRFKTSYSEQGKRLCKRTHTHTTYYVCANLWNKRTFQTHWKIYIVKYFKNYWPKNWFVLIQLCKKCKSTN